MFNKTLFFIVLILFSISCKKTKKETERPISEISFKVNGVDWKANFYQSIVLTRWEDDLFPCAGFIDDETTITIYGLQAKNGDTTSQIIYLEKKPGTVGQYHIHYFSSGALAYFYSNLDDLGNEKTDIYDYSSGTGILNITGYDSARGRISGNFYYDLLPNAANAGKPEYRITEGKIVNLGRVD